MYQTLIRKPLLYKSFVSDYLTMTWVDICELVDHSNLLCFIPK